MVPKSLVSCFVKTIILGLILFRVPSTPPCFAQLRAGAAQVEITPDVKASSIPLGGYAARLGRPSTGVHDPVYAKALVMTQGGAKVGIVSLDLCFLPANIKSEVLQKLKERGESGWTPDNLLLAATHTHTAPDPLAMHSGNSFKLKGWTPFDPALLHFTSDKICEAIRRADKTQTDAKAGVSIVETMGLNRNRRGEKLTDLQMSAVKITDAEGKAIACIVNFAAHPTLYDDKMMEISADWPGAMSANLEKKMGENSVCLFLNGAEGDASPSGVDDKKGDEKVTAFGEKMSATAIQLLYKVVLKSDVQLTSRLATIQLPPRKPNAMYLLAAGQLGATIPQAKELVNSLMPEKTSVQLIRIDDFLFVGMPCEPTAEVGLKIREIVGKAGYKRAGIIALANDWLAYCLMPEQYKKGNYAAMMSFYGDQFAPVLLSGLEAAMKTK